MRDLTSEYRGPRDQNYVVVDCDTISVPVDIRWEECFWDRGGKLIPVLYDPSEADIYYAATKNAERRGIRVDGFVISRGPYFAELQTKEDPKITPRVRGRPSKTFFALPPKQIFLYAVLYVKEADSEKSDR